MKIKRINNDSAVGLGAMILFISVGILACLILATMVHMVEITAQTIDTEHPVSTLPVSASTF